MPPGREQLRSAFLIVSHRVQSEVGRRARPPLELIEAFQYTRCTAAVQSRRRQSMLFLHQRMAAHTWPYS